MIDDEPGAEIAEVSGEYVRYGTPMIRHFPMNAYGPALVDRLRSDETLVLNNIDSDQSVTDDRISTHQKAEASAFISVPRVRTGRLAVTLTVHTHEPRTWTNRDVSLVEEVADRTWEAVRRARAEKALRESEERFQQFANASAAGMWIRDAETLAMDYVSPAIARMYGTEPDELLGAMKRRAVMMVPEDREVALGHSEAARLGKVAIHEFRILRPSSVTLR